MTRTSNNGFPNRSYNSALAAFAMTAVAAVVVVPISIALAVAYPVGAQSPEGTATTVISPPTEEAPTAPATVASDDLLDAVSTWLDTIDIDAATRDETLEQLSSRLDGESLDPEHALDELTQTLASLDSRTAGLLEWCAAADAHTTDAHTTPDGLEWLLDLSAAPLLRNNLRLYLGRWYAQRELYDEALHLLDQLEPETVIAPAMLLYYRSVCLHQLVENERARTDVDRLLTSFHSLPERYDAIAALLQHDLAGVEDGSLDEIARQMLDVRRRLWLHRSGEIVQDREDRIIKSLDTMIEKLEEQQRNQNSSSSQSAGGMRPGGSPAQESQLQGGNGPGEVTRREFSDENGWGNLTPKQRDEALQLLGKDLPAHYRSAVEQYFRTLATQGSAEEND
jgi:hypothetical protein